MKRLLLTLVVAIAFCGTAFAQTYETHWPVAANYFKQFEDQEPFCSGIMIDGVPYDINIEGWEALEVAAFVGEELRGHNMYLNTELVEEFGDPYPIIIGAPIYYTNAGDAVTFKMYDHMHEIEYTEYTIVTLDGSDFGPIKTGEAHWEGYDDAADIFFLNFTSGGITKEIVPFTGEKDHYYLIASPVGEVEPTRVTNMTANEYDLYSFDQSGVDGEGNPREWRNYKAEAFTSLEPGKGYLYANGGNGEDDVVILTFPGSAYTEATSVTIESKSDAPYFTGWNLIGNPYNEDVYIDRSFYRMTDGVINPELEEGAIHPMEGVFVTTEEASEELAFSTTAPGKIANVAMNLSKGGDFVDRAIVRFDNGSQLPKFMFRESGTKLYVQQGSKDFSVVGAEGNGEVPVSFKAEADGIYTINVTTEEVGFSYLHLVDNMNGNDVDLLATPSYTFDARTTDYTSRFKLVFVSDAASGSESFAFFSNGSWVIANDGEAVLQVVDLNGRVLSSEQVSGCVSKSINAAPGVYMLRLVKGDDMKVQKVVVK